MPQPDHSPRSEGEVVRGGSTDPNQPWQAYHTVFTNAKAGMDGVDKEKVQRVVYEMSKGSKYFENEKRREALVMQKIQHMKSQSALLTDSDVKNHEKAADIKIKNLETQRDLSRIWMHVDLDAFYAAVETLENPTLAGKPMAVGGMSMICTANYEARKFGVRAAMPGFIACRLCPDLIFVSPNFEKYTSYSEKVRQVFHDYDPNFLARSLDEAYLDITDQCLSRNMSSEEVAEELRRRVYDLTGLTCSAGVAPNRMIAKVCSDVNKPNGQFIVPNDRAAVMAFVSSLPIRKIGGIGKVTERILKEVLSVSVCEDLIDKRGLISALFSSISTDFFLSVGLGIGGSTTPVEEPRKSLSCERTFSEISHEDGLFAKLEELADNLARELESEELQGRTITLKLKTATFEVRTRSLTLPFLVCRKEDLLIHASKLLKAELPLSLRLMGLRVSHFQGDSSFLNQRTLAEYFSVGNSAGSGSSEISLASGSSVVPSFTAEVSELSQKNGKNTDGTNSKIRDGTLVDCFFQGTDSGSALDCPPLLKEMRWIDDLQCSLCKLEIPSFLETERQEHVDFHFAELLQRRYADGFDLEAGSQGVETQTRRHLSQPYKGTLSKRGHIDRAIDSKGKRKCLSIDAFFSKD
ncbi:hypothetical protein KP509_29G037100 [Ceratopteris richardii]|uniref:DNA polymerase kappa n=1 Tax=Ceratopteris richardii TaxID=49495 RepID=A0A8T2R663_CERRI|nr:hypothetical protein KP509_29G037100 [Ceratopteris richardii]